SFRAPGGEIDWPAVSRHRGCVFRDRNRAGLLRSQSLLPWLPGFVHGLAGNLPGVDGDPDGPAPDRRRLGHGHPSHFGCGYAHRAAAGVVVHSYRVAWGTETLSLGHAARIR